jgi:hemolysin activation/secretion protein
MNSQIPRYAVIGLAVTAIQTAASPVNAEALPGENNMLAPISVFNVAPIARQVGQQIAQQTTSPRLNPEPSTPALVDFLPPPTSTELLPPPDLEDKAPTELIEPTANATKFQVDRFEIVGSTKFKPEQLTAATAQFVGKEITFAELLQARSAITKLYTDHGYVTTGAIIPPQTMGQGVVKIEVVEGQLEAINVTGNQRLSEKYIRDRIQQGASTPLNVPQLLENLQMLRLDPRIANISADLQAGVRPGTNLLQVDIKEAKTFKSAFTLDNSRSPSVGSFRRRAQFNEANLLGFGDMLSVGYTNTKGSNGLDLSYTLPFNAKDGTVWLNYGSTRSNVIEKPFTALDIQAKSRYYELGLRQPLFQKPSQELAMGLLFSRQESQTELGIDNIGPFPLSPGADAEGKTKVSSLRFFQEYTQRSEQHVFALRSQFNFGLPWFNANVSDAAPDSKFLSWRGQGQWLRQFGRDSQFLIKTDIQLTGNSLLPLEQFGLGGQATVRGYRQDALLADSGALISAEFRLPIVRSRKGGSILQVAPFLDFGTTWNTKGSNDGTSTLFGTGLGLILKQGGFSARLDWGIPLNQLDGEKRSLQDRGLYFSLNYAP